MDELSNTCKNLLKEYEQAIAKLAIHEKKKQLDELDRKISDPEFWNNNTKAQEIMKQQSALKARVEPWLALGKELKEITEMAEMADKSLHDDLSNQLKKTSEVFETMKADLRFNGKFDDHDAVVTLSAGAGGTDAQDWTAMLLRMYSRWAEQQKLEITLIEEAPGDEAGIKRALFEVSGPYAYGRMTSESGVHRLVRLSPFNSDNLRQTSFAKVEVVPKIDRPDELVIDPNELKIDVYRAGGHGGQSVNTTDSAVRITHAPTGITVAIQNERSQLQNKETAMTVIRSRLAQLQIEQHKERVSELKGPNQSAEWGNQIRSYVLHPYKQVKDLRSKYETSDPDSVLDGNLEPLINAYLEHNIGSN
jgi:peptide chain release factor 2